MARPVFGIVLCGGRSRRMGGVDKAFCVLAAETLLARTVQAFRPQCDGLVLSVHAGNAAKAAALDLPLVTDAAPGFAGPLAGIAAALDWVAANRPDLSHAAVTAADTPFLPGDFVARLGAGLEAPGAVLACAASAGRRHPVCALWPVALRHAVRATAETGAARVSAFLERYPTAVVDWPTGRLDPFFNINEPEDLAAAERMVGGLRDA